MEKRMAHKLTFTHRLIMAFLAGLFTIALTCLPTQEARAEGGLQNVELEGQLGWHGACYDDADRCNHGFYIVLSGGYRFLDWVGAYVDQALGGIFWEKHGSFSGHTIVNAKFFYQLNNNFEIWGKVGIGAAYTGGAHWDGWGMWGGWHGFAFKLGVGGTYNFSEHLGIGLNFDYIPAIWSYWSHSYAIHNLDLCLHLRYRF